MSLWELPRRSASEFVTRDRPSEPRHEEADVAAAADNVAGCSGANDARNPHEMGVVAGVAGVAPSPGNGGDEPGLSWRAIDQLALRETAEWVYERRDTDIEPDPLEAEIRRRLTEAGIFPEAIEIETDRVKRCRSAGKCSTTPEQSDSQLMSAFGGKADMTFCTANVRL